MDVFCHRFVLVFNFDIYNIFMTQIKFKLTFTLFFRYETKDMEYGQRSIKKEQLSNYSLKLIPLK